LSLQSLLPEIVGIPDFGIP